MESKLKDLCVKLYDIGALKFGNYKMKVGASSPVYLDLRILISFPSLLATVSEYIWEYIKENNLKFKHVCGVPYTALPLATVISVKAELPMLIRRKEAKDYGTRKLIEGKFNEGDTAIIIEDVVTTGSSIMETVHDLQNEGLKVTDTIVVVDREQGGVANLEAKGVKMHALMTLSQIIEYLHEANKIGEDIVDEIKKYLKDNQMDTTGRLKTPSISVSRLQMPFPEIAKLSENKVAQRLFDIMNKKQTNLCVAGDVSTVEELLKLANTVGPHVCVFKTHVDAIKDFTQDVGKQLCDIAQKYEFLIMEDSTVMEENEENFPDASRSTKRNIDDENSENSEAEFVINKKRKIAKNDETNKLSVEHSKALSRIRSQRYRDKKKEEAKEVKTKELTKLRNRKYRERIKNSKKNETNSKKDETNKLSVERSKALSRIRSQRYRDKKREESLNTSSKV